MQTLALAEENKEGESNRVKFEDLLLFIIIINTLTHLTHDNNITL